MARSRTTSRDAGKLYKLMKDMLAGLDDLPPGLTSFSIQGTTYTIAELKAEIARYEAPYATAAQAEMDYHLAIEARQAIEDAATRFMSGAKAAVKAGLGKKSATLAVVGVTPDKTPISLTVDQQVQKAERARATRVARHTMGPRAKAKIKGQLPPEGTPTAT